MSKHRDHGGGLDAAVARFGGEKTDWIDLSTGINPVAYPICDIPPQSWATLPDAAAQDALIQAARAFWRIPHEASVLAAPGASSLIARIPALWPKGCVHIPTPTYNEHAGAFETHGWTISAEHPLVQVAVHPNNPDGRLWSARGFTAPVTIIDESFCDTSPELSHMERLTKGQTVILKSFGKFWGLAGLRLGFAIGRPEVIDPLANLIGPWAVSGPALTIGTAALNDPAWADHTRSKLTKDAARLDRLLQNKSAELVGGTPLFRLYYVDDARAWQTRLAKGRVWSRVFPYSQNWLRLGLPAPDKWDQLEAAL